MFDAAFRCGAIYLMRMKAALIALGVFVCGAALIFISFDQRDREDRRTVLSAVGAALFPNMPHTKTVRIYGTIRTELERGALLVDVPLAQGRTVPMRFLISGATIYMPRPFSEVIKEIGAEDAPLLQEATVEHVHPGQRVTVDFQPGHPLRATKIKISGAYSLLPSSIALP